MSRTLRTIGFLMIFLILVPSSYGQKKTSGASALKKQMAAYQKMFAAAARQSVSGKLKRVKSSEIVQQQQICRAARSGELTKEIVEQTVMPAYKLIYDACWVEPAEVLASSEKLRDARQALIAQSEVWDTLAAEPVISRLETDPPTPPTLEQILAQIEFDCVLYTYAATPMGKKVGAFNQTQTFLIDIQEARCISASNRYRILLGLEPQVIDRGLCAVARDHSKDMRTQNFFAHESPVPGKTSFTDRAARMNVRGASSENIFMGTPDGLAAADAWFHSPGHHKNMLNDSPRTGVGRFDNHHTQMTGWK